MSFERATLELGREEGLRWTTGGRVTGKHVTHSLCKQMKHALNFQESGCWDGSLGKSKAQRAPIIHTHFV